MAAERMMERGGSFVACLGKAWMHADAQNKRTLEGAFETYFAVYAFAAIKSKEATRHATTT